MTIKIKNSGVRKMTQEKEKKIKKERPLYSLQLFTMSVFIIFTINYPKYCTGIWCLFPTIFAILLFAFNFIIFVYNIERELEK